MPVVTLHVVAHLPQTGTMGLLQHLQSDRRMIDG